MDASEGISYRDREGRGVAHRTHAPWGTRSGGVPLMSMTFDATLKDMGRDSPEGFLAAFDRPPTGPVKLLNVDLSTVTTAADLVLGLGEPLEEIIHLDFQSSAAAWKHADLMVYNALLFAHYRVPVHTMVVLRRPQAEHFNMNGVIRSQPGRERGGMGPGMRWCACGSARRKSCSVWTWAWHLWPCSAACRKACPLEEELAAVARRIGKQLAQRRRPPDRAKKLLTDAFLLTGLQGAA